MLTALALGACHNAAPPPAGGDRGRLPAAEEPVLRIYNWADYIGFHTIAQFERLTGIRVAYDLYDSNETLEAKLLVGDSGYDIVSTNMSYYARQIRAGLYESLDRAQLPNWKNLDPHVIADITNDIYCGNDNLAARPFVRPEILNDPAIYPPPEVRARLFLPSEFDASYQRLRTRTWTRIKSGL